MKKTILALSLCMSLGTSFAQSINKVEEKNDTLYISMNATPLHMRFDGMKDNDAQTIARSKRDGAALQFFLNDSSIEESGLNQDTLVQEVNGFVKDSAKYYKQHPNLKGIQIIRFVVFPGYKTPYQIPVDKTNPQQQEFANHFNEVLKKGSKCNKEGFCATTVLMSSDFANLEDSNQKLNNRDLGLFLEKQPKNDLQIYTNNKDYLKPIQYFVVLGTNGYLATAEKIKKVMQQKDIK